MHQSPELAFRWGLRAAERGHVDAQFNTGVFYENGEGVEVDHAAAAGAYTVSSTFRLDFSTCCWNCRVYYWAVLVTKTSQVQQRSERTSVSPWAAVTWFKKAAERGDRAAGAYTRPTSQFILSRF